MIKSERDLAEVLLETRRLCQSWRVRTVTQQKIATVVSELARNIVSHTPGGTVELIPTDKGAKPSLRFRPPTRAAAFPQFEQIMGGH